MTKYCKSLIMHPTSVLGPAIPHPTLTTTLLCDSLPRVMGFVLLSLGHTKEAYFVTSSTSDARKTMAHQIYY